MSVFDFIAKLIGFRPRLREEAGHLLRREEQAQASDFVQDVLVVALKRAKLLKTLTPEKTYAWLRTSLINTIRHARRDRQRLKRDQSRECRLDDAAAELLIDGEPSPLEEAEETELTERVDRALAELNDRQRMAVILTFYAHWTRKEISAHLKCDEFFVSGLLRRALKTLSQSGIITPDDLKK